MNKTPAQIQYSVQDTVGIITLCNPPYNTLLTPVFADRKELGDFLSLPGLKGAIVTGSGRHFCGGADLAGLRQLRTQPELFSAMLDEGKKILQTIADSTVPVAAAIRGSCLGAGLEIALFCHFRFASPNALFGFPEAEQCIMPGLGGTLLIQEVAPQHQVMELILSGRIIQGKEAEQYGLVDHTGTTRSIEHEAAQFLHALTDNRSTKQIRSIMQSILNSKKMSREKALHQETVLFESLVRDLPSQAFNTII